VLSNDQGALPAGAGACPHHGPEGREGSTRSRFVRTLGAFNPGCMLSRGGRACQQGPCLRPGLALWPVSLQRGVGRVSHEIIRPTCLDGRPVAGATDGVHVPLPAPHRVVAGGLRGPTTTTAEDEFDTAMVGWGPRRGSRGHVRRRASCSKTRTATGGWYSPGIGNRFSRRGYGAHGPVTSECSSTTGPTRKHDLIDADPLGWRRRRSTPPPVDLPLWNVDLMAQPRPPKRLGVVGLQTGGHC